MYNKHLLHCMVEVSPGSGHSPHQEETPLPPSPSSYNNKAEIFRWCLIADVSINKQLPALAALTPVTSHDWDLPTGKIKHPPWWLPPTRPRSSCRLVAIRRTSAARGWPGAPTPAAAPAPSLGCSLPSQLQRKLKVSPLARQPVGHDFLPWHCKQQFRM